jgi:serine/threonine protein kinase
MTGDGKEIFADANWGISDKLANSPVVGQEFHGYFVERKIGEGGMGAVYQVRKDKQLLALKTLTSLTKKATERFRREAETLARVDRHPNIVRVKSFVADPSQPFLTMEFVEGHALDKRLEDGAFSYKKALQLMASIADAMKFVHDHGIIHRDLKPGNILLRREDKQVLVTDFGLARDVDSQTLTKTGEVLGTPYYMSPEQFTGDRLAVGSATDIWAMGIILYQLCTGQLPFAGVTMMELMFNIRNGAYTPAQALNSKLPRDLDRIIGAALQRNPAFRYTNSGEFAADCRRLLEGERVLGRNVGIGRRLTSFFMRRLAIVIPIFLALVPLITLLIYSFQSVTLRSEKRQFERLTKNHLTTLKNDLRLVRANQLKHLAQHLIVVDCSKPLEKKTCKRVGQLINHWNDFIPLVKQAQENRGLNSILRGFVSMKSYSKISDEIAFLNELHSNDRGLEKKDENQLQRFFLRGCRHLNEGQNKKAELSFLDLSSQSEDYTPLGELGLILVHTYREQWTKALEKLNNLSYVKEFDGLLKPLFEECRQELFLQQLYANKIRIDQLKETVLTFKKESRENLKLFVLSDFKRRIREPAPRWKLMNLAYQRLRSLSLGIPDFDISTVDGPLHRALAMYAERQQRRGDALFHYLKVRHLESDFVIPRNYDPAELAKEAPSLFLKNGGLEELFEIVLEGSRAGVFLPFVWPQLLSTLQKEGLLNQEIRRAPKDPLPRYWRGMISLPRNTLVAGRSLENIPGPVKAKIDDLNFVINHPKTPEVFLSVALATRARLWWTRASYRGEALKDLEKSCEQDLLRALTLNGPNPDRVLADLVRLSLRSERMPMSTVSQRIQRFSVAYMDRWERTKTAALGENRPFGADLVPMLKRDFLGARSFERESRVQLHLKLRELQAAKRYIDMEFLDKPNSFRMQLLNVRYLTIAASITEARKYGYAKFAKGTWLRTQVEEILTKAGSNKK